MSLFNNPGLIEHTTAGELAAVFQQATTAIARLLGEVQAECDRLQEAFSKTDAYSHAFSVGLEFDGSRSTLSEKAIGELIEHFKRRAWTALMTKLEIEKVMSSKERDKMRATLNGDRVYIDGQWTRPAIPEITPETIVSVLQGFVSSADTLMADLVREEYDFWRPSRSGLKTNENQRNALQRKVIRGWLVERQGWGQLKWNVCHRQSGHVVALDRIMHLLDGRGPLQGHQGPLVEAIRLAGEDGRGETDFFKFRCFKNGNLHLEFKRLDLLKEFNRIAGCRSTVGDDHKRSQGGELVRSA